MADKMVLALVVPCYNEAAALDLTARTLLQKLAALEAAGQVDPRSFIVFVDDGSRDATWQIIRTLAGDKIRGLKLSNNVGHQKALLSGLHYATDRCDACISMDADLQDDLAVVDRMIAAYYEGNDIVYGARNNRDVDSFFKKRTAQGYYQLLKRMKVDVVYNHADFRLTSNRVLQELKQYRETNIFLRGIFPLMGFRSETVYYERLERKHGETKYSMRKMLLLAMDGITSFSGFPLRLITYTGFAVFLGCLFAIFWVIVVMLTGRNVPGWASITLPIYFLGGIQLLALGIIGEYINKIFQESKKRPLYHIEEII